MPRIQLHENNEDRADWAENALDTFTQETYHGRTFAGMCPEHPDSEVMSDAYTAVQDLIGDLLHVAVRYGWNPDEILNNAKRGFEYENAADYEGD